MGREKSLQKINGYFSIGAFMAPSPLRGEGWGEAKNKFNFK
jgi:hypothetical protein